MITINNDLYNNIQEYCLLNNISDINLFIEQLINIGFNIKKYGQHPFGNSANESLCTVAAKPLTESKPKIRIINN